MQHDDVSMYVRAGFAPSNPEFRRLTVACAEAALRSDGAFALAGEAARAAIALRGQRQDNEQEVDLHGLSATEARVAVLSVLSSIQVRVVCLFLHACADAYEAAMLQRVYFGCMTLCDQRLKTSWCQSYCVRGLRSNGAKTHLSSVLQESHRRGEQPAGDLVIITGAGQHSAPEEGPKLRATVERLLAALHLPAGIQNRPGLMAGPAPAAAEANARLYNAGSIQEHSLVDGVFSPGSRRRQQLVAFKFPGARNRHLNTHRQANGRDAERHAVALPASTAEPTAASLQAAVAGSSGDDSAGQPLAGPWSRSEAARLLTEAILLDWTTPWQAGIARGADRRAGGRGSWAAAGGVRSRVAETTARLGTDWLSAAAARHGHPPANLFAPADSGVEALSGPADAAWRASGAQKSANIDAPSPAGPEAMSTRAASLPGTQNAGRLVIAHDALVAWLESKRLRTPTQET